MKHLTKKDLPAIFERIEEFYGFEYDKELSLDKTFEDLLSFLYEEELYTIDTSNNTKNDRAALTDDISNIILIGNYEYRINTTIMSDIIYDGHQSLGELEELGDENNKKSFLDFVFRLRNRDALTPEAMYSDVLINPPADVARNNDAPTTRAIGGNKMAKATDLSIMKTLLEERLKTAPGKKLIISEKLDGASLYLTYDHNGHLVRAEQRGTDEKDTSLPLDVVLQIEGVEANIDVSLFELNDNEEIELRGEVLIEKDKFNKINDEKREAGEEIFSNTRNAGSGILRDSDAKYTSQLTFMGFEAYKIGDRTLDDIPTERIKQDIKEKFFVSNNIKQPRIYNVSSWEEFYDIYMQYEVEDILEESNYAMDGLIVSMDTDTIEVDDRGEVMHSFGAKFSPTTELLKILGVTFTVGKDGRISLVLNFEPKDVGGVMVENSKLDSINSSTPATFLELFNVGDEALVGRMGDVIPKVMYNQKFRPFIKQTADTLISFFEKIATEENYKVIDDILEILHFTKQTKVTSENKKYLLKYATIISELYVQHGQKLKGEKFNNKILIAVIKEILSEAPIKAAKFKVDAATIKEGLSAFDLNMEVDEKLLTSIEFTPTCPACSESLVGLKEGDKTIKCVNEDCEGIKKAVLAGFVEALSTRLDDKPKLSPTELYNYLIENNLTNATQKEYEALFSGPKKSWLVKRSIIKALIKTGLISKEEENTVLNKVYEDKVISTKTIEFLYDNNIAHSFEELMSLNKEDFLNEDGTYRDGFGDKKINNVLHQLNVIKGKNFDFNFIAALSIPNFATSNSKLLFSVLPLKKILELNLDNLEAVSYLRDLMLGIKGFAEKTTDSFIDYMKENKEDILKVHALFNLEETPVVDTANVEVLKLVPTGSVNAGAIGDISWSDRKSFKSALHKQVVEFTDTDGNSKKYLIEVTSKPGSKINKDKKEAMLSDNDSAGKAQAYADKGGMFITSEQFIEFANGAFEFESMRGEATENVSQSTGKQP